MKKIISFDIGEKNFAYCIGTEEQEKIIINDIKHYNIFQKKKQTIIESCMYLTEILENLMIKWNFENETIVLIEQQIRMNTRAQRLAQHIWSYFYVKYCCCIETDELKKIKKICVKFVPAHLKTQHFLGKNTLDSKTRKKWAIIKVNEILNNSNFNSLDNHKNILNEINNLKKKDDVCDTILQLFAFLKLEE